MGTLLIVVALIVLGGLLIRLDYNYNGIANTLRHIKNVVWLAFWLSFLISIGGFHNLVGTIYLGLTIALIIFLGVLNLGLNKYNDKIIK